VQSEMLLKDYFIALKRLW